MTDSYKTTLDQMNALAAKKLAPEWRAPNPLHLNCFLRAHIGAEELVWRGPENLKFRDRGLPILARYMWSSGVGTPQYEAWARIHAGAGAHVEGPWAVYVAPWFDRKQL